MEYRPRTWKGIEPDIQEGIKALLTSGGASFDKVVTGSEVWRARLHGSVFTMYDNGTLFSNPARGDEALGVQRQIAEMVGHTERPSRDILVGLDEVGAGEVLGDSVLAGARMPSDALGIVEDILGPADTKRKKSAGYWDELISRLADLESRGVRWTVKNLPPGRTDRYNKNQVMDMTYKGIVSDLIEGVPPVDCRIVVDDYGVGPDLSGYLESLGRAGFEIVRQVRADERYVECRLASVVAKQQREQVMQEIGRRFSLPGYPVGSGNASDPRTVAWLKEYWSRFGEWPWFVKRSFATVREVDGSGKVRKDDLDDTS